PRPPNRNQLARSTNCRVDAAPFCLNSRTISATTPGETGGPNPVPLNDCPGLKPPYGRGLLQSPAGVATHFNRLWWCWEPRPHPAGNGRFGFSDRVATEAEADQARARGSA